MLDSTLYDVAGVGKSSATALTYLPVGTVTPDKAENMLSVPYLELY